MVWQQDSLTLYGKGVFFAGASGSFNKHAGRVLSPYLTVILGHPLRMHPIQPLGGHHPHPSIPRPDPDQYR